MFLGLNNNGQVVGSYIDAGGLTNGFVYNILGNSWLSVDDPSASATAAFGVNGTTIAGINDSGSVVGSYSDGTNVNGFLATATAVPEPASWVLVCLGVAAFGFIRVHSRLRTSWSPAETAPTDRDAANARPGRPSRYSYPESPRPEDRHPDRERNSAGPRTAASGK